MIARLRSFINLLLNESLVRWFIVGCATVALDTSIFVGMYHLTNRAVISNLISGTIATCCNYLAHYYWSFRTERTHTQSTIIYLVTFFFFLFLGTTVIKHLLDSGVPPLLAKLGTAAVIAPMSFLLMKFVTFKRGSDAA